MRMIMHDGYKEFCTHEFDSNNRELPPSGSVVYVHMEHIYDFFRLISKTSNKYVVVSANSDFGVVQQSENPVWKDMKSWLSFVQIDQQMKYNPLLIPQRCDTTKCRMDDEYSIKCYSYTQATFDVIPENVTHWFCTNADIIHPRVTQMPFGIPDWSAKHIIDKESKYGLPNNNYARPISLYVSFQLNTNERAQLLSQLRGTFIPGMKIESGNVPHDEYVNDLFNSKYVLCPAGNGLNSFRVLEAVYCGAVPIVLESKYNIGYKNIPSVHTTSFDYMDEVMKKLTYKTPSGLPDGPADMDYWRDRINAQK